jgi:hypothetical protein
MNTKSAFTQSARSDDMEYIIMGVAGQEHIVNARSPYEALGIFLGRGRHGLGSAWRLSRGIDGWIVAVDTSGRSLERKMHKLREKNYRKGMSDRLIIRKK